MSVKVAGEAKTTSKGWRTIKSKDRTTFIKFGDAEKLKIKR